MNDTYLIDRCIAMARQLERAEIEREEMDEELQNARERIALLESVELLQELKEIESDASNT